MSNSEVFGSPMILTGKKPVSPFGAAPYSPEHENVLVQAGRFVARMLRRALRRDRRTQRIRKTTVELSRLDDRTLRDIGLNRASIVSAAQEAERRRSTRFRRYRF